MALEALEHYTIQCADLTGTRDFYRDVLGLVDGPRPNFGFSGHWMYCGDVPVVHLMGADHVRPQDGGGAPKTETGAFDHIAFRGSDAAATVANLKARGIEFRARDVPDIGLHQVFVRDPNGIMIEMNFRK